MDALIAGKVENWRTMVIYICVYKREDCSTERWFFVEQDAGGFLQASKWDYRSWGECRESVQALQSEKGCAPWAEIQEGGWSEPPDLELRKFHPGLEFPNFRENISYEFS